MKIIMKRGFDLTLQLFRNFSQHNGPSYAAAIAYHTIISLGPLLLFAIFIAGRAFGRAAALHQVEATINTLAGPELVMLFKGVLVEFSQSTASRLWATGISSLLLLYSASNVFRQLVVAQNAIWEVKQPPISIQAEFWRWLRTRLRLHIVGLLAAVVIIFSLLGSMILSVVAGLLLEVVETVAPGSAKLLTWGSVILIPLLLMLLCLLGFKLLPEVQLTWRQVLPGAMATGLVLALGEGLIVYYARRNLIPTFFGFAGSLVIVMLWAYFSALIFLLGVEFTHVRSNQQYQALFQAEGD